MKRVVFVDDSKMVLMSAEMAVREMIEEQLIELLKYENPAQLFEDCMGGMHYDVLITDINMPQMNGLDLARELKALPHLSLKPILALTTENASEKKELAKEIGLVGWITKPFSSEKLVIGIKRVLKLR
jgi:two-component system chemotaxis response regulator CheY